MISKNKVKPRYYFKRPSFIDGMVSLFDLYNSRQIKIDLSFEEDIKAMKSDFDLVGQDLWTAVEKYEKRLKSKA